MGLSIDGFELKKALENLGWHVARETDHWQMARDDKPGIVVSISRTRKDIKIKTLNSILKAAGLTADDIRRAK